MIYGTMFINYFTGQAKPSDIQANEIVDVVFRGILSDSERRHRETAADSPSKCRLPVQAH